MKTKKNIFLSELLHYDSVDILKNILIAEGTAFCIEKSSDCQALITSDIDEVFNSNKPAIYIGENPGISLKALKHPVILLPASVNAKTAALLALSLLTQPSEKKDKVTSQGVPDSTDFDSESNLIETLSQLVSTGVFFIDIDATKQGGKAFKVSYVNDGYTRITGIAKDDITGKTLEQLKPVYTAAGIEKILSMYNEVIEKRKPMIFPEHSVPVEGKPTLWVLYLSPVVKENKVEQIVGTLLNITHEQESRQIIQSSEERFSFLFHNLPEMALLIDFEREQVIEINSLARDYFIDEHGLAIDVIYAFLQNQISNFHEIRKNRKTNTEIELKTKSGITRNYEMTLSTGDKKKTSLGLVILHDVTKKKKKAARLKQLSSQRKVILENVAVGIAQTAERKIVWANPGLLNIFGFEKGELQGVSTSVLYLTEQDYKLIGKKGYNEINKNGRFKEEVQLKRKDGSAFWARLTGSKLITDTKEEQYLWLIENIDLEKKARLALIESEKYFRTMADAAPVLIRMSDVSRGCTFFNKTWLQFTGRTLEQETGFGWAQGIHNDDYERCIAVYKRHFDTRTEFKMTYRLKRADGAYRYIIDHGVPRFNIDGHFEGFIGTCVDIDDQMTQEAELLEQSNRLLEIEQIARLGSFEYDFKNAIWNCSEVFTRITGLSSGLQLQFRQLSSKIVWPYRKKVLVAYHQCLVEKKRDFYIEFAYKTDNKNEYLWLALTARLIYEDDKPVAVRGSLQDLTATNHTRKKLEEEHQLMVSGPSVIFRWSTQPGWPIEYVSANIEKHYGYKPEHFMNKQVHFSTIVHPDDIERIENLVNKNKESKVESFELEYRIFDISGQVHWVREYTVAIKNMVNEITAYHGHLLNVTSRKQTELALVQSEERYKTLSNLTFEGILIHKKGIIDEVNQSFTRITGYSRKEALGSDFLKLVVPYEKDKKAISSTFNEQVLENYELFIKQKNGDLLEAEIETRTVIRNAETLHVIAIRDITRRKQAEREAIENRLKMKNTLESLNLGIVEIDYEGDILFANAKACEILDMSYDELTRKFYFQRDWQQIDLEGNPYPPEKLPLALALQKQQVDDLRHGIQDKKGRVKILSVNATPLLDSHDQLYGAVASFADITDKIQDEQELANNKAFLDSIIDNLPIGMQVFDHVGFSLRTNETHRKILGLQDKDTGIGQFNVLTDDYSKATGSDLFYQQAYKAKETASREFLMDLSIGENHWDTAQHKRFIREIIFPVIGHNKQVNAVVGLIEDITEKKLAEIRLRESQKNLLDAHKIAHLGGFTYLYQTQTLEWAENTYQIYGLSKDEKLEDFEDQLKYIHPEDHEKIIHTYSLLQEGKVPKDKSFRIINKKNQIRYITERFEVTYDENNTPILARGVLQDVTDQIEAQATLTQINQKLTFFIDSNPLGFIEMDAQMNITSFNKAAQEIFRYSAEEAIGQNVMELIVPPKARTHVGQLVSALQQQSGGYNSVNENITKDGKIIICEWFNTPITDDDGNLTGILALVQDNTRRISNEKELKKAKEQAEAANKAKSEFIANISHEIRTPMNSILGFSELLKKSIKDESLFKYIDSIQSGGSTLLALINDILDISKVEAGRLTVNLNAVNLRLLLEDVIKNFHPQAAEKQLAMSLQYEPDLPQIFMLDELRIRQIITNLLSNAIKFTQEGSVNIRVNILIDPVSRYSENKTAQLIDIHVIDTGSGIEPEEHEDIFGAFNQSKQGSKASGGTGLGLAISKKLALLMNGDILLKSIPGQGSTFTFRLRQCDIIEMVAQQIETVNDVKKVKRSDFSDLTLMIADDSEDNRFLLKELLKRDKFNIVEAANGQEAIDMVKSTHVDIILMDVNMPVKSGIVAASEIKRDQMLSKVHIIAVTASSMDDSKALSDKNMFATLLRKPFKKKQLIDIIEDLIDNETSSTETAHKTLHADPGLLKEFKQRSEKSGLKEKFALMSSKMIFNDIKNLSMQLKEIAVELKFKQAIEQLEQIIDAVNRFDAQNLPSLIREFDKDFLN